MKIIVDADRIMLYCMHYSHLMHELTSNDFHGLDYFFSSRLKSRLAEPNETRTSPSRGSFHVAQ